MNSRSNLVSRAVVVALCALGASSSALANPPHWVKVQDRYDRDYDSRERDSRRESLGREPVYARVVDVDPIVRRVRITTPERECWDETREVYPSRPRSSAGATILGGLIGGVIGHQFGHGNRSTPTVAGAVVGAAIGNQVGQQRAAERGDYTSPVERDVQRCNVSYHDEYEEQIDGYRVTYTFNGREYTTRMPYDPGKRVLIDVNVRPVIEGRY